MLRLMQRNIDPTGPGISLPLRAHRGHCLAQVRQFIWKSFWLLPISISAATNGMSAELPLSLPEFRRLMMVQNDAIQLKRLEYEIGDQTAKGEHGLFEPSLVGSVSYLHNDKPSNQQLLTSLGGRTNLHERNVIYDGGIDFMLPSGGKITPGYSLRQIKNTLQSQGVEYETFLGVRLTQPLLKNLGPGPTLAKLRLAAIGSELAYQDYRRETMVTIGQGEAGYWELYLLQEQQRISEESLQMAEKIWKDLKNRLQVGKATDLDVLQAEAGVAARRVRLEEARQRVSEGATRLGSLFAYAPGFEGALPRAIEPPSGLDETNNLSRSCLIAFSENPEFAARRKQAEQENLRVSFAKNQRLPQLDMKADFGRNGLGAAPGLSWDDAINHDQLTWSIGVELRVPLGGGIKERHELAAARISRQKAEVALREAEIQIENALTADYRKIDLHGTSITNGLVVVAVQQRVVDSQLDRLAAGAVDTRTVLEAEQKLFEAKLAVVESQVALKKAGLELEIVRGTLLQRRQLEVTRPELRKQTEAYLRQHRVPGWSTAPQTAPDSKAPASTSGVQP